MKKNVCFKHIRYLLILLCVILSCSFSIEPETTNYYEPLTTAASIPLSGQIAVFFNPGWMIYRKEDLRQLGKYFEEAEQLAANLRASNSRLSTYSRVLTIYALVVTGALLLRHKTTIARSYRTYIVPRLRSITRTFKGFNEKQDISPETKTVST